MKSRSDGGRKGNGLTEQLCTKLAPKLKCQVLDLAKRFCLTPGEVQRMALHAFVERFPAGCGKELEDEFFREIGKLGTRDTAE